MLTELDAEEEEEPVDEDEEGEKVDVPPTIPEEGEDSATGQGAAGNSNFK